jgi:hypothetical protein
MAEKVAKNLSEIREFTDNIEVGSAELMALADLVCQINTARDIRESAENSEIEKMKLTFRQELIAQRIESRTSEIPGYLEAYLTLEQLNSNLEHSLEKDGYRNPSLSALNFLEVVYGDLLPKPSNKYY